MRPETFQDSINYGRVTIIKSVIGAKIMIDRISADN